MVSRSGQGRRRSVLACRRGMGWLGEERSVAVAGSGAEGCVAVAGRELAG